MRLSGTLSLRPRRSPGHQVTTDGTVHRVTAGTTGDDPGRDTAWRRLVESLQNGKCIPFLGAGACEGYVPMGTEMAERWGAQEDYPLHDAANLASVMQYIATMKYGDPTSLKEAFVAREFAGRESPDFSQPDQIHRVLAECGLPLYVTTNYDDFMYQALRHVRKDPKEDHGRWYAADSDEDVERPFDDPKYEPSPERPLVFHLHGRYRVAKSLVLTEDDYINYLVRLGEAFQRNAKSKANILPNYVYSRLRANPLLFIGYSLRDWTFLVLFRILLQGIPEAERRKHISVQIDPQERRRVEARAYLEEYLRAQSIQIFWESAPAFAEQLKRRLEGSTR